MHIGKTLIEPVAQWLVQVVALQAEGRGFEVRSRRKVLDHLYT